MDEVPLLGLLHLFEFIHIVLTTNSPFTRPFCHGNLNSFLRTRVYITVSLLIIIIVDTFVPRAYKQISELKHVKRTCNKKTKQK